MVGNKFAGGRLLLVLVGRLDAFLGWMGYGLKSVRRSSKHRGASDNWALTATIATARII